MYEDDDERPPIVSSVSKISRKTSTAVVPVDAVVAPKKNRLPAIIDDGSPVVDPTYVPPSEDQILGIDSFEIGPVTPEKFLEEDDPDENASPDDKATRSLNARKNDDKIAKPSVLKKNVSTARVRGLVTMFGQRADRILSLLEDDEQTDGALTLIQRTLLQTLVDVLPVVERGVRRSKARRGVYQLNQVVSQIRELMQDMQSLKDKGQLGASVADRVIRPSYQDLAVQISLAFSEIESSSQMRMEGDTHKAFVSDILLPIKRNLATYLMQQYGAVREGVVSSLS